MNLGWNFFRVTLQYFKKCHVGLSKVHIICDANQLTGFYMMETLDESL